MRVHARFSLVEDARLSYWHNGGYIDAARFKLAAVKGEPFGPATPQGTIEMLIVNPEASAVFRNVQLGTEFDVVFSPAEPT
jgi:hypothetical protein